MATIKPFNGYRFTLKVPDELSRLVAPPYDMIDNDMVDRLYSAHPNNIVRIIQNRPEQKDRENRERHIRAAGILSEWIENGILTRDEKPSVYGYEQKFTCKIGAEEKTFVRTGVVAAVALVDFKDKIILPHEATLSGPKKDRYELLDASATHTEQIFGLLDDDGPFYTMLRSLVSGAPDGVFVDDNGVQHSLFRCDDDAIIKRLSALAEGKTILIADGHHRYETALNYYNKKKRPECAYTMMTLVSTADPGLVIRPFHRLIKKDSRQIDLKGALAAYFSLEEMDTTSAAPVYDFITGTGEGALLFLDARTKKIYRCILHERGELFLRNTMQEHSMAWKKMPVSMINVIVINTILGFPLDGHVLHDVVDYLNDVDAAMKKCTERGEYYGAFFIRPSSISTVEAIVEADERMPQKSTNFFPKMYSGLVLYKMES